jgi:hypothetical protein
MEGREGGIVVGGARHVTSGVGGGAGLSEMSLNIFLKHKNLFLT